MDLIIPQSARAAHDAGRTSLVTQGGTRLAVFSMPAFGGPAFLPAASGGVSSRRFHELAYLHGLTYTVHLPLDLTLDHPVSLEMAAKVIACTRDLSPWAYVLHLDGRAVEVESDPTVLSRWRDGAHRVLKLVAAMTGGAERLCVENLENYAPEAFLPVLEQVPAGLCIDVGHLWLTGRDPVAFLDRHLTRTRVIHLHGVGSRDHESLLHQGAEQVAPVLDLLSTREYGGILTLEVFDHEAFSASRRLVEELVNGRP